MPKIKVLIVDDETEFATTLAERLELRDFEVVTVDCGERGIAVIREGWTPDVVILDLRMPGLDGLATLELIKNYNARIEVIILTGHGSTSSGITGMRLGVYDYLMKPIDMGELVGKIEGAVLRQRQKSFSDNRPLG